MRASVSSNYCREEFYVAECLLSKDVANSSLNQGVST